MADWYKSHEISVTNRLGRTTKFQLFQYLASAPTVKKLPLIRVPEPEFQFGEYGLGVKNDRCTIELLNNYGGEDLLAVFEADSTTDSIRFKINCDFGTGAKDVFDGVLEYKDYDRKEPSDSINKFTVDFISGYTAVKDMPFDSDTAEDIIALMPVYSTDFVFAYQFINVIITKLCLWPDEVLYAATNLEAENWRYYTNAKGTSGVPDPNVLFREMKMPIHNASSVWASSKLGEMLQEFMEMFFCSIGYSTSQEKAIIHHFNQGQRNQSYDVLEITGTSQTITDNWTQSVPSLDADLFLDGELKRIGIDPIQSITVTRGGSESLPNHPTSIEAENSVNNPLRYSPLKKEYLASFWNDWLVQSQPDPSTSETNPGRLFDRDYYGSTSGLTDFIGLNLGYWANLLFKKRNGVKGIVLDYIDPMFPFKLSSDNTIHRCIRGRHNPVEITTDLETIEIGPTDNFS